MKTKKRPLLLTGLAAFAMLATADLAPALDRTWDGTTGNWDVDANWSDDTAPTASDYSYINNSGTALLPAGLSGSYNRLFVGTTSSGAGTININGGVLSGSRAYLGNAAGSTGTVTVTSGTWSGGNTVYVGYSGTGHLLVNGGRVSILNATIGGDTLGQGSVTVSSGTLSSGGVLWVGQSGKGNLLINGGLVSTSGALLGRNPDGQGSIKVTGQGSAWINQDILWVGNQGSNNTLTIENEALVKVGDAIGETISFSIDGGTNNYLRLDGGYIALFGNQITEINDMIVEGFIQLWDGSAWVTATLADVEITEYTNDAAGEAAALEATGYSGLGGYTVATAQAVPEPTTTVLIALGLGAFALCRRRSS